MACHYDTETQTQDHLGYRWTETVSLQLLRKMTLHIMMTIPRMEVIELRLANITGIEHLGQSLAMKIKMYFVFRPKLNGNHNSQSWDIA